MRHWICDFLSVASIVLIVLAGYGGFESFSVSAHDEAQIELVRATMEHDGCKRFQPWAKKDDPLFMMANATCYSSCKIVSDLFKSRNPTQPRITVGGECRHSLTMLYKCMCKFSHGLFTWHSLKLTVRHFLDDVIEVEREVEKD